MVMSFFVVYHKWIVKPQIWRGFCTECLKNIQYKLWVIPSLALSSNKFLYWHLMSLLMSFFFNLYGPRGSDLKGLSDICLKRHLHVRHLCKVGSPDFLPFPLTLLFMQANGSIGNLSWLNLTFGQGSPSYLPFTLSQLSAFLPLLA